VGTAEIGVQPDGPIGSAVAVSARPAAIDHQGRWVPHGEVPPVTGQGRVTIRQAGQEGVGILDGAWLFVLQPTP
jgi:hypothetical protein